MSQFRESALAAYREVLSRLAPEVLVREAMERYSPFPPLWVIAMGKAAVAMACGIHRPAQGLVVCPYRQPPPEGFRLLVGAHPVPDERSAKAGLEVLRFAGQAPVDATVIFLISGGASSLVEVPKKGVTIASLSSLFRQLTSAATPIDELNTVRRHLSKLKNGRLLDVVKARRVITLLLSDVADGQASIIASGPTLRDDTTLTDVRRILRARLGLVPEVLDDALPSANPYLGDHDWEVLAGSQQVADIAYSTLPQPCRIWSAALKGEARREAIRMLEAIRPGEYLVAAGETTVTLHSQSGQGGRNQEAALAAAVALEGGVGGFAALATDGIDGSTRAAGAIVDGTVAAKIRSRGGGAKQALECHDSGNALASTGALVTTGPSGNNVGDLWIAYRAP